MKFSRQEIFAERNFRGIKFSRFFGKIAKSAKISTREMSQAPSIREIRENFSPRNFPKLSIREIRENFFHAKISSPRKFQSAKISY